MGPRFLQRGNAIHGAIDGAQELLLQWGRAFYSAEIYRIQRQRAVLRLPSMGPRFLQRGNRLLALEERAQSPPSMGPRFLQRGNSHYLVTPLSRSYRLQWGRAFYSAEIT